MTPPGLRTAFSVGHWSDPAAQTGCTVVIFDRLVAAVVEVRGGSPGTRETDLLASDRLVGQVDAILLTGGSAHGLAAADGVMQFLREQGRGFPTQAGPVPIVSAAVIYDLAVGRLAWPHSNDAYAACRAAQPLSNSKMGAIGAGTGATTSKLWKDHPPESGGFGWSTVRLRDQCSVHALAVVNAVGAVVTDEWTDRRPALLESTAELEDRSATTLVVVVVEGDTDQRTLRRITVSAHDAMARAIIPSHTLWDGDLVFAAHTGTPTETEPQTILQLTIATELAVEQAIRNSVPR